MIKFLSHNIYYASRCSFCEKDSDCKNCLFGEYAYCVDYDCSTYCKSTKEGDSCSSDSDCNPNCAIKVKLYCVDNKCPIFEKCAFDSCKNTDNNNNNNTVKSLYNESVGAE